MRTGETIHATTVAIDGLAVAIRGASGSGKSDLALRLIDRGATLIADDRTQLHAHEGRLIASAPEKIAGMIEVRGLGILPMRATGSAPLALMVEIGEEERMPEPRSESIDGVAIPLLIVDARGASAPIKVELALSRGQTILR